MPKMFYHDKLVCYHIDHEAGELAIYITLNSYREDSAHIARKCAYKAKCM